MMDQQQSPLLRLPYEVRLIIYEYLLFPSILPSAEHATSVANLRPDYHTYQSSDTNDGPFTLTVKTIEPYHGPHSAKTWRRRTTYHVRTGPFMSSTTPTTYRILLSPYTAHLRQTIPSLLPLNRQIHAEASKVFYSTYTFSFHTNIETAIPFFSDLTPISRAHLHNIALTQKGIPFFKEYDRAEWSALCNYLANEMQLRTLNVSVVAGKYNDGWDDVKVISKTDFADMRRLRRDFGECGVVVGVDLDWVEQLFKIKGLRDVRVKALVQSCPRFSDSEMITLWVAFSKSLEAEGGFGDWVREVMVEG